MWRTVFTAYRRLFHLVILCRIVIPHQINLVLTETTTAIQVFILCIIYFICLNGPSHKQVLIPAGLAAVDVPLRLYWRGGSHCIAHLLMTAHTHTSAVTRHAAVTQQCGRPCFNKGLETSREMKYSAFALFCAVQTQSHRENTQSLCWIEESLRLCDSVCSVPGSAAVSDQASPAFKAEWREICKGLICRSTKILSQFHFQLVNDFFFPNNSLLIFLNYQQNWYKSQDKQPFFLTFFFIL